MLGVDQCPVFDTLLNILRINDSLWVLNFLGKLLRFLRDIILDTLPVLAMFSHSPHVFTQLEVGAASVKAIGELDSLLEWLESFHTKDHKHHHDSK